MVKYYNELNNFESQSLYEGYLSKVQNQIHNENKVKLFVNLRIINLIN